MLICGMWLQWGHGSEAVETPRRIRLSMGILDRFNGATALRPWRQIDGRPVIIMGGALQWGHGSEAVETFEARQDLRFLPTGFNGATALRPWRPHR